MTLTNSQILNGIGYLQIWINQAQVATSILVNPDSSQTAKNTAQTMIINALKNIYKLMNTACQAQGITPPSATFSAQDLQDMGIT